MPALQRHPTLFQTYAERSEQPNLTPLATYLLRLVHIKKTNLCVSADVATTSELLRLAEDVGDQICMLKTHADIIKDFTDKTIRGLNDVARRKKFVIFEDRKFGDIGSTLSMCCVAVCSRLTELFQTQYNCNTRADHCQL